MKESVKNPKVTLYNTGATKLEYAVEGNRVIFEGGALALDLSLFERDVENVVYISRDRFGALYNTGLGLDDSEYVAEILIPARQYEDVENPDAVQEAAVAPAKAKTRVAAASTEGEAGAQAGEDGVGADEIPRYITQAVPFNIDACELVHWLAVKGDGAE